MEKRQIYETVFNDLLEIPMFRGVYDAKNGSEHYMYGINIVMNFIANKISEKASDEYNDEFDKNMIKSEEKARWRE